MLQSYVVVTFVDIHVCHVVPDDAETTDTGSAFSYFESSSVGRSVVPEGPSNALDSFTGPVYGLVAALLEQDMARAPQDKRGHRFLELFLPSVPASFQVCIMCINTTRVLAWPFPSPTMIQV